MSGFDGEVRRVAASARAGDRNREVRLVDALMTARQRLVALGGEPLSDGTPEVDDFVQREVLRVIDDALVGTLPWLDTSARSAATIDTTSGRGFVA